MIGKIIEASNRINNRVNSGSGYIELSESTVRWLMEEFNMSLDDFNKFLNSR